MGYMIKPEGKILGGRLAGNNVHNSWEWFKNIAEKLRTFTAVNLFESVPNLRESIEVTHSSRCSFSWSVDVNAGPLSQNWQRNGSTRTGSVGLGCRRCLCLFRVELSLKREQQISQANGRVPVGIDGITWHNQQSMEWAVWHWIKPGLYL